MSNFWFIWPLTNFDFFLLGDMNINMATTKSVNDARQLNNIAAIYGQLINEPTRITNKSSSLIDLINTNSPERVVCSGVAHVGYRKLSFDLPKGHTSMTYGRFKHFKHSVFRSDISNHNSGFLSSSKDPNELWSEWKSNFLAITDENAPIRTKRVRSQKSPWITADLKKLMNSRDIMKIKAINSNDPHDCA